MAKISEEEKERRKRISTNIRWGLRKRHQLHLLLFDDSGRASKMKIEPHYINVDWEGRPYLIGHRRGGWRPASEKNGWSIIFYDRIIKCNILEEKFKPRMDSFLEFKNEKEDTFIRPSEFEFTVGTY